jgi:DinB superfamily
VRSPPCRCSRSDRHAELLNKGRSSGITCSITLSRGGSGAGLERLNDPDGLRLLRVQPEGDGEDGLLAPPMTETPGQYKSRILRHVAGRDPLPLLAAAPATLAALVADVPPAVCARRPTPGKWSIQEIVAHLADDELVGAYRIRLILSAPGTAIQAFDQDVWAVTGR